MSHKTLNYAQRIRESGHRLTPQREMILDAICAGEGHSSVEEIYERVQKMSPSISLATVYRTLDFLCEMRLAVAADIGGRHMVYEIAGETPHHHLVCRNCGATAMVEHAMVETFLRTLDEKYDFKVDMDHMALFGLCSHCRETETTT